jgi:hypothetical protein
MRALLVLLAAMSLSACGGGPGTSAGSATTEGTPKPQESVQDVVDRCIGEAASNMDRTDEYDGMHEAEALVIAEDRSGGRVVAREGDCLGRSRDLRDGRVNFVVSDGKVVWGAIERVR